MTVARQDRLENSVRIYHNPRCSKSRETLRLIREAGIEPEIVRYLDTPLDCGELRALCATMNIPPAALVRTGEAAYASQNLEEADDDALLDAMAATPVLMNRPIVVTQHGTRLCRPPEIVQDILPATPSAHATGSSSGQA